MMKTSILSSSIVPSGVLSCTEYQSDIHTTRRVTPPLNEVSRCHLFNELDALFPVHIMCSSTYCNLILRWRLVVKSATSQCNGDIVSSFGLSSTPVWCPSNRERCYLVNEWK